MDNHVVSSFWVFIFFVVLPSPVHLTQDNSGTEFYITYGENVPRENQPMDLFLATEQPGVVMVTVEAPLSESIFPSKSYGVTSGSATRIDIPIELRMTGSQIEGKGIHITASDRIIVYGVNKELYTTDAFLAFPVSAIGMEYYTVSYHPSELETQFQVVGTNNDTVVTIQLAAFGSVSISFGGSTYTTGQSFDVTLQEYEVLQIQTMDDLSGTHIFSDKPVSVFSGNKRTNIPDNSRDHLVEQLLPVDTWGTSYATVPIPGRQATTGDFFKIVASEATSINITNSAGTTTTTLDKGEYHLYEQRSDEYVYVESEEPIMLVQFSKSQIDAAYEADPAMILIPPIDQYKSSYVFAPPTKSPPYKNYLSIIIDKSKIGTLTIDGNSLSTIGVSNADWHDFSGDNNLAGISFQLPDEKTYSLQSSDGSKFATTMYGLGNWESYGMLGGVSTQVINEGNCTVRANLNGNGNDGRDNDCDGKTDEDSCVGAGLGRDDDGDGLVDEDCTDTLWSDWVPDRECPQYCLLHSATAEPGEDKLLRQRENVASSSKGATCTASSYHTSRKGNELSCDNAIDGVAATAWKTSKTETKSASGWINVTLAKEEEIAEIRILAIWHQLVSGAILVLSNGETENITFDDQKRWVGRYNTTMNLSWILVTLTGTPPSGPLESTDHMGLKEIKLFTPEESEKENICLINYNRTCEIGLGCVGPETKSKKCPPEGAVVNCTGELVPLSDPSISNLTCSSSWGERIDNVTSCGSAIDGKPKTVWKPKTGKPGAVLTIYLDQELPIHMVELRPMWHNAATGYKVKLKEGVERMIDIRHITHLKNIPVDFDTDSSQIWTRRVTIMITDVAKCEKKKRRKRRRKTLRDAGKVNKDVNCPQYGFKEVKLFTKDPNSCKLYTPLQP